jgi:hypothetical protein
MNWQATGEIRGFHEFCKRRFMKPRFHGWDGTAPLAGVPLCEFKVGGRVVVYRLCPGYLPLRLANIFYTRIRSTVYRTYYVALKRRTTQSTILRMPDLIPSFTVNNASNNGVLAWPALSALPYSLYCCR